MSAGSAIELGERIMAWAEDHPKFDTEIVESIMAQASEKDYASSAQIGALENIISGFKIP